jgi:hypothetical protein
MGAFLPFRKESISDSSVRKLTKSLICSNAKTIYFFRIRELVRGLPAANFIPRGS